VLGVLVVAGWLGWREYQRLLRDYPERFPWTALSLADPIGPFTGRKLAALAKNSARCEALLSAVGSANRPAPPRRGPAAPCGYEDGIRLDAGDGRLSYAPSGLVTACPVAAALVLWERDVVQPAATRFLGAPVTAIDHYGSYSCRRVSGRLDGPYSEHATADAIDIAAFRLGDGRRVSVLDDWRGTPGEVAFLHAVRDGACTLFATVLSPDYNRTHADHLHFDQAQRGSGGWRGCR
jgi:hypothetical protein